MGYSSDILWHQTKTEGFKKILESSMFKCAYSLESIYWKTQNKTFAIPMISFCNLALSDLDEYLGKYGNYTIGMRKSWKYASKTSLVWYRDKNSISLQPLMDYCKTIDRISLHDISKEKELLLWTQLCYTKNYEGPLKRRGIKCYRFFDEFEFRYVPNIDILSSEKVIPILTEDEYIKYKEENRTSVINKEALGLEFDIEDIEYILVKDKGQIGNVNIFLNKYLNKDSNKRGRKPIILTYDEVRRNIIGIDHHKYE